MKLIRPSVVFLVLVSSVVHAGERELSLTPSFSESPTAVLPGWALGVEPVAAARTTVLGLPLNMGPVDRILRGVIAATLVGIGSYRLATNQPSPGWSVAFLAIALIPTATAATGYCPLYQAAGLDSSF